MLRIAVGYLTEHRRSAPVVLYCGHDGVAMQRAVNAAPASLLRLETGWFHFHAIGKRRRQDAESGAAADGVELISEPDAIAILEADRARLSAELAEARQEIVRLLTLTTPTPSSEPTPEDGPTLPLPAAASPRTRR